MAALWPMAALADTSGIGVTPTTVSGNPASCASDLGITGATTLTDNSNSSGTVTDGTATVTVTTSDSITFGFSAQLPSGDVILAVLAKGGSQGGNLYDYRSQNGGGVLADSNLHPPATGNGNQYAGISHILFCYGRGTPPSSGGGGGGGGGTTTTPPGSTTTPPSTTTTTTSGTTTTTSPVSSVLGKSTIKKKAKKKHKKQHVKAKKISRPPRALKSPGFTG
jgi:New glue protein family